MYVIRFSNVGRSHYLKRNDIHFLSVILEHQQFEMVVRLMNTALTGLLKITFAYLL